MCFGHFAPKQPFFRALFSPCKSQYRSAQKRAFSRDLKSPQRD